MAQLSETPKGVPAVMFNGKPLVVGPRLIGVADFGSLDRLSALADAQGLPLILTTGEAWNKAVNLINEFNEEGTHGSVN